MEDVFVLIQFDVSPFQLTLLHLFIFL